MKKEFPKSASLNGADYFLLALDHYMRKFNIVGNACRIAVDIDGPLSAAKLRARMADSKAFDWLGGIRLKKRLPFLLPKWVTDNFPKGIRIIEHNADYAGAIPKNILDRGIDVYQESPVQIDIIKRPGFKTTLILSWHHALMDAHGAEILIKLLSGNIDESAVSGFLPESPKKLNLMKSLSAAKEAKDYVMASSREPVAKIIDHVASYSVGSRYRIIRFTMEETEKIYASARAHGARLGSAPYFLSASARAIKNSLIKVISKGAAFWVPLPLDNRRRGTFGSVISNQASFIFYRLPFEMLTSLKGGVESISSQMMEQMRQKIHTSYITMMEAFKRMPLPIYSHLVKDPAASFFFSVVGDFINDIKTFSGYPVDEIIHYPPNGFPPGFTVVFMRYGDLLKVIVGYYEDTVSEDELNKFEAFLRDDLL